MPGREARAYIPPEFKADAVRLYRSSNKSIRDVTDNLGISPESCGGGSNSATSTRV
jgi:transposase-like protein